MRIYWNLCSNHRNHHHFGFFLPNQYDCCVFFLFSLFTNGRLPHIKMILIKWSKIKKLTVLLQFYIWLLVRYSILCFIGDLLSFVNTLFYSLCWLKFYASIFCKSIFNVRISMRTFVLLIKLCFILTVRTKTQNVCGKFIMFEDVRLYSICFAWQKKFSNEQRIFRAN